MPSLNDLIVELKARNVRRTLAIYLSSALTAIGIVRLFVEVYSLPKNIFPVVVTLLTFGLVNAFLFAWYHGKEGRQKFRAREISLHIVTFVVAVVVAFRTGSVQQARIPERFGKSIAVLPFTNMSESKEEEYFSNGITEDILTQLSKIRELKVISRTSVMKYKGSKKTVREIADELGVSVVLEGSVRRDGPRVRIVAQLINAETDEHIWAETYDRQMQDIFAIQSDVAQRIAGALEAELSPEEQASIETRGTPNLDAYTLYLRGREFYNRYQNDANENAIVLFKQALVLDPTYAAAYAGLGDAYAQRVGRFGYQASWLDSSIAMSEKALSIAPRLAEAHKALGVAYVHKGKFTRALQHYRDAVRLNPNFAAAVSNVGVIYLWRGELDNAVPWLRRAIQLDPTRPAGYRFLGIAYTALELDSLAEASFKASLRLQANQTAVYADWVKLILMQGRSRSAEEILADVAERYPTDRHVLTALGNAALFGSDLQRARTFYDRAVHLSSVGEGPAPELAYVLLHTGNKQRGKRLLDTLNALLEKQLNDGTEDFNVSYDLARVYAVQQRVQEALEMLEHSIQTGWRFYRFTLNDPLVGSLRSERQFQHMMENLKATTAAMRARVENEVASPPQ